MIYVYDTVLQTPCPSVRRVPAGRRAPSTRGSTEVPSHIKLYPSVSHTYTSTLRPVIGIVGLRNLDEVSNRIPPTSQCMFQVRLCIHSLSLSGPCLYMCILESFISAQVATTWNILVKNSSLSSDSRQRYLSQQYPPTDDVSTVEDYG